MGLNYIDECLERAEMASPGPWHIGHVSERGGICELADIDDAEGCLVAEVEWRRDQSFIAASREMIPELAKRLKKACESLRGIAMATGTHYPIEIADELEKNTMGEEEVE